jgi:hypothetical protein
MTKLHFKIFFQDYQQTPDTMNISFNCGSKTLIFEMRIWNPSAMEGVDNGVAVYGSEEMVQIGRRAGNSGFMVFDRKGHEVLFDNANELDAHARNFIDCIRSRQAPNAEIMLSHVSTTYAHLANIVSRTGRQLKFEPKTETKMKGWFSSMRMTLKDYKLLAFLLVVTLPTVASFDKQNASGMGDLTQAKIAASDGLVWLDNYQAAIKESKATGKPIFLEFRCAP